MIRHIYDEFAKRWYHGGTIWFYSDPHFNDPESTCLRKNYPGDDEQVRRINSKVGKKDTIIFLGDIGDTSFIKKIKGYKVLIAGNHDAGVSTYKKEVYHDVKMVSEFPEGFIPERNGYELVDVTPVGNMYDKITNNGLFDEVYEGCLMISDKIILSHEPVDFKYAFNIHGHDHGMIEGYNNDGHFNCCAEHIGYYPVCIKEIVNSGRLKNIPDIHRTAIDNAIVRKSKRNKK